jgi:uncharacterized membrane protein (DUF373 family)
LRQHFADILRASRRWPFGCSRGKVHEQAEETAMQSSKFIKPGWRRYLDYRYFERVALGCILIMIAVIAAFAIVFTAVKLAADLRLGEAFVDRAALQDTIGLILIILILLEFNHSVLVSLSEHSGATQVRMLVRITILVVARKLMLIDFSTIQAQTLLGFGGLLVALGGLYWMISDGDRRQHRPLQPHEADAEK